MLITRIAWSGHSACRTASTHPVIATLDIPLSACGAKREFKKISLPSLPQSGREGRPAKRRRGESTPHANPNIL